MRKFNLSNISRHVVSFCLKLFTSKRQHSRSRRAANVFSAAFVMSGFFLFTIPHISAHIRAEELEKEQKAAELQRKKEAVFNQDSHCLAMAMYWEPTHDKELAEEDRVSVGQNILNRTVSGIFPTNICSVVHQVRKSAATGKNVAQYSYSLDRRRDVSLLKGDKEWPKIDLLARKLLADWNSNGPNFGIYVDLRRRVEHSLWYHADYVKPEWSIDDVKNCRMKELGIHAKHFHYAFFETADPEGHKRCVAQLQQTVKRVKPVKSIKVAAKAA